MSAVAPTDAEDPDDMVKYIWGTNISLNAAMNLFEEFLQGFKPKYRAAYNEARAKEIVEEGGFAPPPMPLYDNLSFEQGEVPLYKNYISQMLQTGQVTLNLDMTNMLAYPPTRKMYNQLKSFPQEVIPMLDQVLTDAMIRAAQEEYQDARMRNADGLMSDAELALVEERLRGVDRAYRCRPYDGENVVNMRDLNPSDTDRIVTVKGLVIRATATIPDMTTAFFRCLVCQHTVNVEIDRGRINEPTRCPRDVCNSLNSMSLIHNRSVFTDKQIVRLQETPDAVPDGQTPHTVSICLYDELVDLVKPGDRIVITGVFRSVAVRVNPRQRSIKALFKTFVDAVHIKRTNVGRMGFDPSTRKEKPPGVGVGGEDDDEELLQTATRSADMTLDDEDEEHTNLPLSASAEMEKQLLELSRHPDIYDMLARSMAPSIYEMEDVKKGILLQLFGGTNKSIINGGGGGGPRYRGDINVLMVGDPGTSKSQILQVSQKCTLVLTPSMCTRSLLEVSTHRVKDRQLSVSRLMSLVTPTPSSSFSSLVLLSSLMAVYAASMSLTR